MIVIRFKYNTHTYVVNIRIKTIMSTFETVWNLIEADEDFENVPAIKSAISAGDWSDLSTEQITDLYEYPLASEPPNADMFNHMVSNGIRLSNDVLPDYFDEIMWRWSDEEYEYPDDTHHVEIFIHTLINNGFNPTELFHTLNSMNRDVCELLRDLGGMISPSDEFEKAAPAGMDIETYLNECGYDNSDSDDYTDDDSTGDPYIGSDIEDSDDDPFIGSDDEYSTD